MNNNRTFAGGYQPKPLPPGTTMGSPPRETTCPANPAPQGEQQQQEPSSDGQIPSLEQLSAFEQSLLDKLDRLASSQAAQTKALEEYTKATANLTIHIGLLIQAMADGEDDTGTGPDTRTLG